MLPFAMVLLLKRLNGLPSQTLSLLKKEAVGNSFAIAIDVVESTHPNELKHFNLTR